MRWIVTAGLAALTLILAVGSAGLFAARSAGALALVELEPRREAGAASFEPARTHDELRARIARLVEAELIAGLSVGVVEDGEVAWVQGFGTTDPRTGRPAEADTVYRVGSFSKTFLSLAVSALANEGAFRLDDRVVDLVPEIELENPWADTDPVRVAHLLEHSAGFDEMRFNEIVADEDELDWRPAQVLALNPRSRRVRWRPGTRHAYSHPGYTLAGHLVEKHGGEPFEDVLERRLFGPLGMESATFRYGPEVEERLAPAFEPGPGLTEHPHRHLHHRPGSSLYVSARDMARFVAAMAGRGKLGGRQVLPYGWIETIENGSTLPYGALSPSYGLGVYSGQHEGVVSMGHGGWMPGHQSSYRYYPTLGSGHVLLTNDPVRPWILFQVELEVRRFLLRDQPRERAPPAIRLPDEVLDRLVGTYERASPSVEISRAFVRPPLCRVTRQGDALLWMGSGCRGAELVPVTEDSFRHHDQARPSVRFTRSPEGADVVWDANSFGYFERVGSWKGTVRSIFDLLLVLAMLGGLFWPLAWIPALLSGGTVKQVWVRAVPCAGAWAAMLMAQILFRTAPFELGQVGLRSVAVFWLSWVVAICGLAGPVLALRCIRRAGRDDDSWSAGVVSFVLSLGVAGLAAHLAVNGVLGLRTWMW